MSSTVRFSRSSGAPASNREYNILTNEHHKDARSVAAVQQQQAKCEELVKRAITKELRSANHGYNILSMAPKYGMSEEALATIGGKLNVRAGVEIKGGKMCLPVPGASYQHPFATEFVGEGSPKSEERRQPRHPKPQRPTNIITHRYVVNNDERVEAERAALLHRLEVKAVVMAPQNPLTGTFRDLDAELAAQEATAVKEGMLRSFTAPQSMRTRGQIVTVPPVVSTDGLNACGLPQRAALRQTWEHQRDADEALRETDGSRVLARTNPERVLEQMRRGHDAISNLPFGLSRSEIAAGNLSAVAGADVARPLMPMSSLQQPSLTERLKGTCPRPVTSTVAAEAAVTQVLRAEGPRSTHERVFNNVASANADSQSRLTYTYDGRRAILLPTLSKTLSEKSIRDFS